MTRVVVLSTADWAAEVWTNKQYIAAGLSDDFDVLYVESLGLRAPRLTLNDARRILQRLRPSRTKNDGNPARRPPARMSISSPRLIPFHGSSLVRWANSRLMNRLARRLKLNANDLLWTFSPLTYNWNDYVGATVYHSVDMLHEIPGIPRRALLTAEESLVKDVDQVIASSSGVQRHLSSQGARDVLVWENVADTKLFSQPHGERLPRAIFVGHITPSKIDFACLQSILDAGVELALAGPITLDGTSLSPAQRAVLGQAEYLGLLNPVELAQAVGRSQVGLIPYTLDDHTAGIFPMKLYEYLAAGVPVISTALPSLDPKILGLILAPANEFGPLAQREILQFSDGAALARSRDAREHSWESRVAAARQLCRRLVQ